MMDTAVLGPSILGAPRSPASISMEPSGRGFFKPAQSIGRVSEPPRTISPPVRLTRKRAATLNTESASPPPRIGDLALSSARTADPPASDLTREQVCLCQPDPKIPRPRNAFILYRQHYQAQVVAQNPGLANPEISKIIGEQWREQAPEVKSDWKRLAEEEKQRHRRQYPGYRYQPRRAGKPTGIRPASGSSTDDPVRCPKCSGRYISTPSTPSTPFTPSFAGGSTSHSEHLPQPFTPVSSARSLERPASSLQMSNPRVDNPLQQNHRRTPQPHFQLHLHRGQDDMDLVSPSSDLKRRRFNTDSLRRSHSTATPVPYPPVQTFSRSGISLSAPGYGPQSLESQGINIRPGTMGPPPQQSPASRQPRSYSTFDESLRLPPLQSQLPNPNSNRSTTQRTDSRAGHHNSQIKVVEDMVMTIPYLNKIKILTKISPPLVAPSATSPMRESRGAVIAVEGSDKALLSEVGTFVNQHLSKDISCAVKTWTTSPPSSDTMHAATSDTEMAGTETIPSDPALTNNTQNSFIEYLSIISEWHQHSLAITKYITPKSPTLPSHSTTKLTPIALLPQGFSLTSSDTYALRIPINDSYAPVDHWQWMATLWRGIVGPDLTIYVKRAEREEVERHGSVEVRVDCAGIIVRVAEAGRLDEKTARRLGFEVMEFVRSVEGGRG